MFARWWRNGLGLNKPIMKRKATLVALLIGCLTWSTTLAGEIHVPALYRAPQSNLFVYKPNSTFRGAVVEVFFANGDLVTSQRLVRKRLVIDFSHVRAGAYVIRVTKGDKIQDFQFVKM